MSDGTGLTVTIRKRIAAHDAHYSGGLLDGAHVLKMFGDVATELLVRLDGDEGLFRAYDSVEFLAPVTAGDFIEATGVIVGVGNRSRTMQFEARKVIANLHDPHCAPSAADVLNPPIIVCRARGTCVVPTQLQRRKQLTSSGLPLSGADARTLLSPGHAWVTPAPHLMVTPAPRVPTEVILTAAIVGAELTRAHTPHVPLTAAEIAAEAARCCEAGASIIHLHVRNPDGSPSQSASLYREAINAIAEKTDVIVQVSTGGAVGMSLEERAGPLECTPEMASLNCGSLNFGDVAFINLRPQIREMARRIRLTGAVTELECYEVSHIHEGAMLAREGLVDAPLHFQFVLGVPGGIPSSEEILRFMVSQLPDGASWGVAAIGRGQQPMTELAIRLGGNARVGLEDNIYISKGVLAEGSAPLVDRAATFARGLGRSPVSPTRARELLRGGK